MEIGVVLVDLIVSYVIPMDYLVRQQARWYSESPSDNYVKTISSASRALIWTVLISEVAKNLFLFPLSVGWIPWAVVIAFAIKRHRTRHDQPQMSEIEGLDSGRAPEVVSLIRNLMQSIGTVYGIEAIFKYEVVNPDPHLLVDNRGLSGQEQLQECLDFVLEMSSKYGEDGVTFDVTYQV